MKLRSYITWFDDNDYIGLELAFPGGSTWKIERKIKEAENLHTQGEYEIWKCTSQARATFVCSKVAGNGPPTALIKIHMQIPFFKTATEEPSERAKQADPEIPHLASSEVKALTILTESKCSSSPYLIDSMHRQQTDGWVPGGYIHYNAMEMLPGVTVCDHYDGMERQERDELRKAFKKAWIYLIDFENFHPPTSKSKIWRDIQYIGWHLAQVGDDYDYDDMTNWIL
ncbi:uncharacterized protein An12g02300 [Aspergillus niger]|uniref:Contig An12c0070, genomic contig n=2 Tax=Aspergillus niger TaxID=5061 RepID=A2QYS3_ASPNC|nr:uncharacterized protein An12g02300 [Aspergillus niger]CAK41072.1 unnamed protein product [Aspergillus niger]